MKYIAANDNRKKARTRMTELNIQTETPVIFRKDKTGELTAFLPALPASPGMVVCYAHVGQHSEASEEYMRECKGVGEDEYSELLAELRSIYETGKDGLKLVVRRADSALTKWMRREGPRHHAING